MRPMTLPIASRRTLIPAARIQSATASPASASADVPKRRVSRSPSSLWPASRSARAIGSAATVSAVRPGRHEQRHVVAGGGVGDAEADRHEAEERVLALDDAL